MKGKLSRKWARASIICMGIFLVGCVVTVLTNHYIGWLVGIPFIIAALVIKFVVLRCPGCGHGGAIPQWNRAQRVYHCPRCGAKLEYDD